MIDTKRMFYCSLCDATSQDYMLHDKKLIVYSDSYCQLTLIKHIDYVRFINIVFIEYANQILQYI